MQQPLPKSASYRTVMHGLLRMHQFSIDGREESEEADLLRESMSEPWEGLSDAEKERMTGLSKDLYEISEGRAPACEPTPPQVQEVLDEVCAARDRGDCDAALASLRQCGRQAPASLVSYLRGTIWQTTGDAETAAIFFRHALNLDPANEKTQAALSRTLEVGQRR